MKLESVLERARNSVIPSVAVAILAYSQPVLNSYTKKYTEKPDLVTIASYYGKGTKRDPKPHRNLSRLDDTYGASVWNYFCAMPNRHGELIGKKVRVNVPSKKRSAILVVADNGPNQKIHPDRRIDISYHAAGYLGFRREGVARVEVEFVQKNEKIGPAEYE